MYLSGEVTAIPGKDSIDCSVNIMNEIRRGDVILVGDSFFRVDCRIEGSGKSNQPERAKPPLSVSSTEDHDPKGRNTYLKPFSLNVLPLDGDYDGSHTITCKALKHGCTNDIRQIWNATNEELSNLRADPYRFDSSLQDELIRLKLLTRPGSDLSKTQFKGDAQVKQKRIKVQKQRKWTRVSNTHLIGTELGSILKQKN